MGLYNGNDTIPTPANLRVEKAMLQQLVEGRAASRQRRLDAKVAQEQCQAVFDAALTAAQARVGMAAANTIQLLRGLNLPGGSPVSITTGYELRECSRSWRGVVKREYVAITAKYTMWRLNIYPDISLDRYTSYYLASNGAIYGYSWSTANEPNALAKLEVQADTLISELATLRKRYARTLT